MMVLTKIATNLPLFPGTLKSKWKHLSDLHLADLYFGFLGCIDILLGVYVFSTVVCQGQRLGPLAFPVPLNTCFGWVLSGTVGQEYPQRQEASCSSSSSTGDKLLQKIWEVDNCSFQSPPCCWRNKLLWITSTQTIAVIMRESLLSLCLEEPQ